MKIRLAVYLWRLQRECEAPCSREEKHRGQSRVVTLTPKLHHVWNPEEISLNKVGIWWEKKKDRKNSTGSGCFDYLNWKEVTHKEGPPRGQTGRENKEQRLEHVRTYGNFRLNR